MIKFVSFLNYAHKTDRKTASQKLFKIYMSPLPAISKHFIEAL